MCSTRLEYKPWHPSASDRQLVVQRPRRTVDELTVGSKYSPHFSHCQTRSRRKPIYTNPTTQSTGPIRSPKPGRRHMEQTPPATITRTTATSNKLIALRVVLRIREPHFKQLGFRTPTRDPGTIHDSLSPSPVLGHLAENETIRTPDTFTSPVASSGRTAGCRQRRSSNRMTHVSLADCSRTVGLREPSLDPPDSGYQRTGALGTIIAGQVEMNGSLPGSLCRRARCLNGRVNHLVLHDAYILTLRGRFVLSE